MAVATGIGVVAAAGTLALLVLAARASGRVSCEACLSYRGRTECRVALGPTREEATRTAIDNACALLASGMTESVECTTRTEPLRVTCQEP
jgi:hypothetical protein